MRSRSGDTGADIERRIKSGEIKLPPGTVTKIKPAPKPKIPMEAPAPKPALDFIADAEREAALESQRKDFADPAPRPGSAAAGITSRTKQKTPGVMNKTEAAFAEILEAAKRAGEIADYLYEEHRLKVGVGRWYTPDFFVTLPDGRAYLVEVKAYRVKEDGEIYKIVNEDSAEKIAAALLRHPFPVKMAYGRMLRQSEGGGYDFIEEWSGNIEP